MLDAFERRSRGRRGHGRFVARKEESFAHERLYGEDAAGLTDACGEEDRRDEGRVRVWQDEAEEEKRCDEGLEYQSRC